MHMKNNKTTMRWMLLLFLSATITANGQAIRIACIGNSITFGATVVNREKNAYPAQLQAMLGPTFEVMNFGVNGATLLKKGNLPYWNTPEYSNALKSNPAIVFIKLGTNDSKLINRPYYNEFNSDYKSLILSFRQLPSHPRIVLLLPIPSFLEDSSSIFDPIIKNEIIPRIQQLAYETGCEIINLYPLFIDKSDLFPDKVHPSSLGATLIAKRLYELVKLNEKGGFDIFTKIKEEKKTSSFYGFECIDFTFQQRNCKVVKPKKAAAGLPWVWRARFWGHEPQTDQALLERGFHVVYCDASELFGNPEAVALWDKFYAYLQQCGLAKKAALEGMSRGGVYIYNWAMKNPEKVACIYADAPVLDLKSWPGGLGKSQRSKTDWEIFKTDYSLSESQAIEFNNSPLNNAEKIAQLGFPMLHVVGDADEVVPADENTNPFEVAIKNSGGNITVIHKPGVGHHPHSLANPSAIVEFILGATHQKTNFATIPTPGSEYRSGAGWKEGTDWWTQNNEINALLANNASTDIVFIGNSITQGIAGDRASVTHRPGKAIFESIFNRYRWVSAGISGDRTQHIIWRLQHGNFANTKIKIAVLAIGVNNFPDDSAEEIAEGIHLIVDWMKKYMPTTKIILIGPLPAGVKKQDLYRIKYDKVQSLIQQEGNGQQIIYFPLTSQFVQPDGDLNLDYCSGDGIHLIEKGYEVWARSLQPLIEKILTKK
jgi:lysophospholipase L1-like esterase/pimeloyl-ACP methyl ester carboxylesterase